MATAPASPFLLNGFPRFQLNSAASPSSNATNVFPPPFLGQLSNMPWMFVQQFMKQQQQQQQAANSPNETPLNSVSPSVAKKLQLDADGKITCPICDEKIGSDLWQTHVQVEKQNLRKLIENLVETRRDAFDVENLIETSAQQERKKREFELERVCANQKKRLNVKSTLFSSSSSTTSQPKFTFGSIAASFRHDEETRSGSRNSDSDRKFCKSCERYQEFLVTAVGLDEPRCMDCYRKYRRQVGALPLTITGSPTVDGSHTTSSTSPHEDEDFQLNDQPTAKRPKIELL
ncbi:hypothetical protein M3Y95_00863600 [Aphelenchoides besseyi]|nr:hypothetical protein M3Y95_00863600 [Aphelenchoides besseyi]